MSDNNDPKGTSLPDGFDNERRRKLWKKLQGDLPLEEKVSCWKREYRADLVQQLRDIETGNLPIGMWHLIGAIPGAVEPDEPGYRIDERFAEWLAEATTEDMDAHNLACELVAANLKADLLIPAP